MAERRRVCERWLAKTGFQRVEFVKGRLVNIATYLQRLSRQEARLTLAHISSDTFTATGCHYVPLFNIYTYSVNFLSFGKCSIR